MSNESPEVVAAAMALARADSFHYANKDNKFARDAHMQALQRYRAAIAPKRSRAEVAVELAEVICFSERRTVGKDVSLVAVDTGKVSDLIPRWLLAWMACSMGRTRTSPPRRSRSSICASLGGSAARAATVTARITRRAGAIGARSLGAEAGCEQPRQPSR
jgi:hypothetical protein